MLCVFAGQQEKCPQSPANHLYIIMLEANMSTEEFVAFVMWNPYWSCCVCMQPIHIILLFLLDKSLFLYGIELRECEIMWMLCVSL